MDKKVIKDALDNAIEDIIGISKSSPNERLVQEAQLRCALYSYFRDKGMTVHAEADYKKWRQGAGRGKPLKCDLRIIPKRGNETWIELKIASYSLKGNRDVLHGNASQYYKRWKADIEKLKKAPGKANKMLIILGLFDDRPDNQNNRVVQRIEKTVPKFKFWCDLKTFTWRDIKLNSKAWIWQWEKL